MKHTNKLWVLLVALIALAALCAFAANAETVTGTCGANATWSYDTETKTLTISGTGTTTETPWSEFQNEIETLVIEEGITKLYSSFMNCEALENVSLPEGLISIGEGAFMFCTNLKEITIPSTLEDACSVFVMSGLESVTFCEGIERIDAIMFGATKLRNVVIPNSVQVIEAGAFGACSELETIHLGKGLQTIEYGAFNVTMDGVGDNSALKNIETCMSIEEWELVEKDVFPSDGDMANTIPNAGYKPETVPVITDYHFPDLETHLCSLCGETATDLGKGICGNENNGSNLTWKLSFDGTLTISGTGAMADYTLEGDNNGPWKDYKTAIETVIIEEGVTTIGEEAFSWCENLQSIAVPESVESIGTRAFHACSSLTDVQLPTNQSLLLGDDAFSGCRALVSITIPANATFEVNVFLECTSLKYVTLEEGLKQLGQLTFQGCDALTDITIPASLEIAYAPFVDTGLKTATVADGMEALPGGLFLCTPLEEVSLPNSLKRIGTFSFAGCTELKDVHFGDQIQSIGFDAFGAAQLESTYVCENFEHIYTCMTEEAWANVTSNTIEKQEIIAIVGEDEMDTSELPDVLTEEQIYELFGMEPTWTPADTEIIYDSHVPNDAGTVCTLCGKSLSSSTPTSGTCGAEGDNLTWSYDTETKTLTISGTGAMADYYFEGDNIAPWYSFHNDIEVIQIEEGVTEIGNCAFFDNGALSDVSLPESLTRLGEYAFASCESLTSITIPKNVTTAFQPFAVCGLTTVILEDGLTKIDKGMFAITKLRTVVIPDTVETIGTMAFAGCDELETVQFGHGVRSIGYGAFSGFAGLIEGNDVWNDNLTEIRTCMNADEWATVELNAVNTEDETEVWLVDMFPGYEYKQDTAELVLNSHVPNAANTFCTLCGKSLNASDPEPPIEDPHPGQEHQVNSVIWAWTADGTGATAIGVCTLCSQQVLAAADVQVQTNSDGSKTCNATAVIGGQTFSDTRVISVDPNPPITPKPQTGFRCSMCSVYEEYKGKGFIGVIVSLVHTFVHLAARISAR